MSEIKQFEQICQDNGIMTTRESHLLSNTQLFNFYKAVKKLNDPVEKLDITPTLNISEYPDVQACILIELQKKPMTVSELSRNITYAKRTLYTHTKKLINQGIIEKNNNGEMMII